MNGVKRQDEVGHANNAANDHNGNHNGNDAGVVNGNNTTPTNNSNQPSSSGHTEEPSSKKRKGNPVNSEKAQMLVYTPGENLFESYSPNKFVKVFVPIKYISYSSDKMLKVWGTDIYTDDSDLVAACVHCGYLKPEEFVDHNGTPVSPSIQGVVVGVRIAAAQKRYTSTLKNNIRSRSWTNHSGNSFIIESFKIVEGKNSAIINSALKAMSNKDRRKNKTEKIFLPNVTVVFNLSNEPCLKYTLNAVADKGFEDKNFTSYRLLNEVLFVETMNDRYELSLQEPAQAPDQQQQDGTTKKPQQYKYRWARVLSPHTMDNRTLSGVSLPLDQDKIEVIAQDLNWSDIQWGTQSVCVKGKEYSIWKIWTKKKTHHDGMAVDSEEEENNSNRNGNGTTTTPTTTTTSATVGASA